MEFEPTEEAVAVLEKTVNELEADLLFPAEASRLLDLFVRAERIAGAGKALVARRIKDAKELARRTGTSVGKAREVLDLGSAMEGTPALDDAVRLGEVSPDQASVIARAEAAAPGSAEDLLDVARSEPFHVLAEQARLRALEARDPEKLSADQHAARRGSHRMTDLSMVRLEAEFEPHVGVPLVNRWEAEARTLATQARKEGRHEPFAAHLADALAVMLAGRGKVSSRRPELVVLASHEVAKRGWMDVRDGEVCKIPGIGPVSHAVAREIAADAFLSGVFYDGVDLRHFKRWSRHIPVEVRIALELGPPPEFDGVKCARCGNRFRPEIDHRVPHASGGPMSTKNADPLCWECHQEKTAHDRRERKLRPP
jgi:HNH endonuclease